MESLALHEVDNLVEYVCELEKCKDGYLICAAVRDTLHGIDESSVNALKSIGMNNIGTGWNGYVFLKEGDNIVLDEGRESNSSLIECKSYRGMQIQLVSKSWRAGNKAMIVVNDYNFAVDSRGLNIVVLDVENRKLVDSVCFDFFPNTKRPCIRDKYFMQIQIPASVAEKNQENIFDIDEKIDNIIGKYHFDRYHPRYSKFKKARKLIKDLSDEWKNYESIACIMIGYSSEKMELDKKNFLSDITLSKRNQIDFFSCKFKARLDNPPPFTYAWEACDYKILEHIVWESYSRIYVISNCGENFIGEWFRKHKIQYVSLYDYFLAHGVFDIPDDSEYYNFIVDKRESRFIFSNYKLDSSIWEIYDNNQKLKDASVDSLKLIYAKKLFFLFLTNKNFISAKKYLDEIISLNQDETEYVEGWQEINDLIGEIKRRIKQREKQDIISIWVDFLGYEDTLKFMPFVSSLHGKSIWFNNFFSMNGFTHETQRTIFTGKNLIEDQTNYISNINLYNSPLLRVLEKNGYKIVASGKYLQDLLCARYESQRAFADREIESGMLWDAMRTMLMTESPCFIMLHCMQSHYPYVFDGMDDKSMFSMTERTKAALSNLDSQIRFYLNILGKNTTSIIFNDHGNAWYWPRQHVLFTIAGEVYRQREVNDVCSLVDFHKVVKQLIDYREIKEEELSREAAEFQGVPVLRTGRFTNPRGLLTEAKPAYWPIFRGYKGIVTKEYVYIHFAGGREWLSRRDKMQPKLSWYARPDDICDKKILLEMRDKAGISYGNEPPDYGPRSEYYLSIQETYEKNYSYNAEKNKLVNALFADMPDSSVALYLGNGVSRELYLMLSLDSRKKISFIIDKATDCSCADLGVPIIPLEKVVEQDVRHIIVPMRTVPGELSDFLQTQGQGIHAFGLYGWFEVNGYHTKHNFYDFAIQSMDAPLPSPLAIPDFLHYASPDCPAEVVIALVVEDETTLRACLHDVLRQVPMGIKICCFDLTGKAMEVAAEYQKIDNAIQIESMDGYSSLPMKLNEMISSVKSKYILFLAVDEHLHAGGLAYLHELIEKTEADVAAAAAVVIASKEGKPALTDFSSGAFQLKKEAQLLAATFNERYAECQETTIPRFTGNKLYRVDYLRQYNIRFPAIQSGWKDIFCLQTIFQSPKYVKAVSPVCISDGSVSSKSAEVGSAKELVGTMFAYQQAVETLLAQMKSFGNNTALCDKFRDRAMYIFDWQYFSGLVLDEEKREIISQTVQEEIQNNPTIGVWWIKYLFMHSSFLKYSN